MKNHVEKSAATSGIIGLAVGDALGVPVEFAPRKRRRDDPVMGMRAYGTHDQPAGTWSDDASLTLCLADSLTERGIDFHHQASRFVAWLHHDEWTPHGEVFDVGGATREAISQLARGVEPTEAGPTHVNSNGNGSLMRILPLAIYLARADRAARIETAMQASRLTHGHARCQIACALFVEVAAALVRGDELARAVADAQEAIAPVVTERFSPESQHVGRLFNKDVASLPESSVSGSGYVVDCLEASLWCALRARSYSEGVLAAVNLGDDTDTTGAVTGGLLGLRFGIDAIPVTWQQQLARHNDIVALCDRFQRVCEARWNADGQSTAHKKRVQVNLHD
jgi:ADP-ribosylglycohydrolase